MAKINGEIKYFVYVRKSSEGEDRQIQSIGDQIKKLKELAKTLNLKVVETFSEAKSAKAPYCREVFTQMIQRIEKGEANGILCWEINRLSRNPVDSGKLQWLLQEGKLISIRTMSREFRPDDNAILLSVESGSANQFILDLKKGVKRGIDSKLEKGLAPISAPLGYLNTKTEPRGSNYIIIDPERFSLVRKMWDLMLTGSYNPTKILEIATNEWGLKTRKMKRRGDKPLSRSTIYRIFTDPFYTGQFYYKGQLYQGKHESMISLDEFDSVQVLLGREGKPRPHTHEFPFTGIIHCHTCGSAITAIEKTKIIKKTKDLKTFTYYYCTKRKKDAICDQKKYLSAEELEGQIIKKIEKIDVFPIIRDWALMILKENDDSENQSLIKVYESQQRTLIEAQRELDNLIKMRCRELITEEEFVKERKELKERIVKLNSKLASEQICPRDWKQLTARAINFASSAIAKFERGDLQTQREILMSLGENQELDSQELLISLHEWFTPIEKISSLIKKDYGWLEMEENVDNERQKEAFNLLRPELRGRPDLNRQPSA